MPDADGFTSSIKKFHYNGCTQDLDIVLAFAGKHTTSEFSGRSEISGNVAAHTFKLRVNFTDGNNTSGDWGSHTTITGAGASKLADGSTDTAAHFIMGYRTDNCGAFADLDTCDSPASSSDPYVFCAANSGTSNTYTQADGIDCADQEEDFSNVDVLEWADIPSEEFTTDAADFGL